MKQIWCCYHDGNERSKRVQEKCGFVYQRSTHELNSNILIHVNLLTKEDWEKSK
jgi:[ribosomal protein S5]-alanine N-acetyltransferase